MKKILFLISIFTIIIVNCYIAFASDQEFIRSNKSINIESLDNDSDKNNILGALYPKLNNLDKVAKEFRWNNAAKNGEFYKIYWFRGNLHDYFKDNNFSNIIAKSKIIWETPILSDSGQVISTIRAIKRDEGKWGTSVGYEMPLEYIEFYIKPQNIENILKLNNINEVQVKHVRLQSIGDFFYINNKNNEYAIPLVAESEKLNIKNMELCKLSDLIDKLLVKYPLENGNVAKHGGKTYGSQNMFQYLYVFIGLLAITFIAVALILKRRKIQSKTH